ncbi:hypothetical protein SEPCBS119000_005350 [Sporothrix epigloea]|uniref:Rab-GAP TBC domain-containing protein n=1 Tax=Sporothrix epigloea TaxID=1892477 RepID=A0ABP0DXE8_9PEZI
MTASKSSKSSSFHSISSDDNSILSNINNFENISLDDDASSVSFSRERSADYLTARPNLLSTASSADLRAVSFLNNSHINFQQTQLKTKPQPYATRELSRTRPSSNLTHSSSREITSLKRPSLSNLQSNACHGQIRSTSTSALASAAPVARKSHNLGSRSATTLCLIHRSSSPNPTNNVDGLYGPKDPATIVRPRRSSWQSTRERKTVIQLEMECDEEESDEIPEGLILDNVPITPRPPSERSQITIHSPATSKAGSPDRTFGKKRRSVGNGTPTVATAQGSLRSSRSMIKCSNMHSELSSPAKMRAKSWTSALSELNLEAKTLTEKLEEHADKLHHKSQRSSTGSMPAVRRASTGPTGDSKLRHKSALPDLPPLRRNDLIIDPLPISKEKEAVLSRTRPSWLPPKDPAEEKRHLKEYKKMMAYSLEAEKRRAASKQARCDCRDTAVSGIMQIWEQDVIPRWTVAIHERRTRDLWWRGVAPRSRGAVWARAIGNELGLTETSFHAALKRARNIESRAKSGGTIQGDEQHLTCFEAIHCDVQENTWRDLKIFQAGAPLHQGLVDILMAYTMYRSDIGYITGCNTIAAILLLNLPDPASAFVALANMLNRPLPLSFHAADPGAKASAYNLVLQMLSPKSAILADHLLGMDGHDPDVYLNSVFTSLFTDRLALDQAARLLDVYVFEGDAVLIRAGVALLLDKEATLLGTQNAFEVDKALCHKSRDGDKNNTQSVVAKTGEEDRWMQAVREAGNVANLSDCSRR